MNTAPTIPLLSRTGIRSFPTFEPFIVPPVPLASTFLVQQPCQRLPSIVVMAARPPTGAPLALASKPLLIVCPKLLGPQWQEELQTKFSIPGRLAPGRRLIDADPEGVGALSLGAPVSR